MANVIDYLIWRGDLSFKQSTLNEVDNVLLVFLNFLDFEDIIPKDPKDGDIILKDAVGKCLARHGGEKPYYGALMPSADIEKMAKLMAKSTRFGKARLTGYVKEISIEKEQQFSAFTAILDDDSIFVTFSGTDDTIIGWKEDMNMSFFDEIPGQKRAVEYLEEIANAFDGPIRVGGHSKGGNLSVYAAAKCQKKVQERISRVYNNDGPGFSKAFFESEGYLNIKSRILKLVPQESVVGMLLANDSNFTVVYSKKSGVIQHNSYLWEVRGKHFVRRGELEKKSIELSTVINTWIEEKDYETRKNLIAVIYELLTASDAKTLTDINNGYPALFKAMKKVDPKKRELVLKAIYELIGEIIKSKFSATQKND